MAENLIALKQLRQTELSGFVQSAVGNNTQVTYSNLVYQTGNQEISGLKNFNTTPTVNGTGFFNLSNSYPVKVFTYFGYRKFTLPYVLTSAGLINKYLIGKFILAYVCDIFLIYSSLKTPSYL